MLLMVEKGIRGGLCHCIYQYPKAGNKYMKELPYTQYCDVNNLYGLSMSQKLPVNNSEWIKYTSQFSDDLIKDYNEENDEGYSLEVDV